MYQTFETFLTSWNYRTRFETCYWNYIVLRSKAWIFDIALSDALQLVYQPLQADPCDASHRDNTQNVKKNGRRKSLVAEKERDVPSRALNILVRVEHHEHFGSHRSTLINVGSSSGSILPVLTKAMGDPVDPYHPDGEGSAPTNVHIPP